MYRGVPDRIHQLPYSSKGLERTHRSRFGRASFRGIQYCCQALKLAVGEDEYAVAELE